MELWAKRCQSGPVDVVLRDKVARRWIEAEILRLTNLRARDKASTGTPGPEGSVGKLVSAELNKRITETCIDVMGADGMLFPDGYPMSRPVTLGSSATIRASCSSACRQNRSRVAPPTS